MQNQLVKVETSVQVKQNDEYYQIFEFLSKLFEIEEFYLLQGVYFKLYHLQSSIDNFVSQYIGLKEVDFSNSLLKLLWDKVKDCAQEFKVNLLNYNNNESYDIYLFNMLTKFIIDNNILGYDFERKSQQKKGYLKYINDSEKTRHKKIKNTLNSNHSYNTEKIRLLELIEEFKTCFNNINSEINNIFIQEDSLINFLKIDSVTTQITWFTRINNISIDFIKPFNESLNSVSNVSNYNLIDFISGIGNLLRIKQ